MLVRWELFFKFQGRRNRVEKNKLVFCLLPFVLAGRSVISPLTAINRQACSPPCPGRASFWLQRVHSSVLQVAVSP